VTDDYTGDVVPGGPAAVRVLDEVTIRKLSVGPMGNDAYAVSCHRTGARLLVDAAAEPERLLGLLGADGADGPVQVVTTHRHHDHVGALGAVLAASGASHAAGAPDLAAVTAAAGGVAGRPLAHGDVLTVGAVRLEVVALRGHTPGAVALVYREPAAAASAGSHASDGSGGSGGPGGSGSVPGRAHLFTGDSLFPGGPGRTTSPEAFASLMSDLERRVFDRFDDATWVYPGHGRDTTLGAERPHLPAWRARGW
jgi:glyoxylase-like metal-dependent hydrolase (beta-lactamase superfamily II)